MCACERGDLSSGGDPGRWQFPKRRKNSEVHTDRGLCMDVTGLFCRPRGRGRGAALSGKSDGDSGKKPRRPAYRSQFTQKRRRKRRKPEEGTVASSILYTWTLLLLLFLSLQRLSGNQLGRLLPTKIADLSTSSRLTWPTQPPTP